MANEIVIADVICVPTTALAVGESFKIQFTVAGGSSGFFFPFSNESVTEKLIEFLKEDDNGS